MIAVGAVVGILIVMILVVFIVMTALCVLRKKGRKTVYDTPGKLWCSIHVIL